MDLLNKIKENFFQIFIGNLLLILITVLTMYFPYNFISPTPRKKI